MRAKRSERSGDQDLRWAGHDPDWMVAGVSDISVPTRSVSIMIYTSIKNAQRRLQHGGWPRAKRSMLWLLYCMLVFWRKRQVQKHLRKCFKYSRGRGTHLKCFSMLPWTCRQLHPETFVPHSRLLDNFNWKHTSEILWEEFIYIILKSRGNFFRKHQIRFPKLNK